MKTKRYSFIKNVLTLGTGTIIAQAIPLLAYPILSRLYNPEQFGVLASINSVVSIIAILCGGQYLKGILVAKTEHDAQSLVALSVLLSIAVSLLSVPVLIIIYNSGVLGGVTSLSLLLLAPLIAVLIGIYNVYNEWCVRHSYFRQVSVNKITNSGANAIAKVAMAFSTIGLVIGELFGRTVSATMCLFHFFRKDKGKIFREVSYRDVLTAAKKYKQFPLYSLPGQFLNVFAAQIPIFVFGNHFSKQLLGQFSMAQMVLSIPISVVSLAFYDAFRQRANDIYQREGRCDAFYRKIFKYVIIGATVCCIFAMLILPQLFEWFLGKEWRQAGSFAVLLSPSVFIGMVNTIFTSLWIIADKLKYGLWWQVLYFICTALGVYLGILLYNTIEASIIGLSIGLAIAYIVNMICTYNFSKGD